MRIDKKLAFELRKGGKTYNEISKVLKISKGTLSFWFKNVDWSVDISARNFIFNFSPEKLKIMQSARKKKLEEYYEKAILEAKEEYFKYKNDTLFIAGLMVYAGEGDHSMNNSLVRIANSDPLIILVFKGFLQNYYLELYDKIRISILLYPDLDDEECLLWWSKSLMIDRKQFHKPVHIIGKHKTRRLRYGVGSLIISSKFFKVKLLELERLSLQNLTRV